MALNTTPATWVTNETVTATKMNTEVRDALTGIQAAWISYSPAWTTSGGSSPSLGNGTLTGKYTRFGKTVFARIKFVAGSTTTFGTGSFRFSIPVTAHADYGTAASDAGVIGNASLLDASTSTRYYRRITIPDPTFVDSRDDSNSATSGIIPFTWANTDSLTFHFYYEAA